MSDHPTPSPITITIGGKAYTATCPTRDVWRSFQEHASAVADSMAQIKATATLLAEIIGTEAKNDVASRLAAGELLGVDIIDAVSDAANQWRALDHPTPEPPITVTIGGKAYSATCPAPEFWQDFEGWRPDDFSAMRIVAAASLLQEMIGREAKADVADRLKSGEIVETDVFDAIQDAANQWGAPSGNYGN